MKKALPIWPVLLFCALAPISAHAQVNQINAIYVTPTPAQPNQAVTIFVITEGTCSNLLLNFGDGTSTQVPVPTLIPATHTYAQAGTYTLSAVSTVPNLPPIFGFQPPPNCGGIPTVTLPVLPAAEITGFRGGLYCFLYGCNPTISAMPLSLPEPGNTVIFQGSGFGVHQGTAWMYLQSYGGNWPLLRVQLQIDPGYWQPGVVVATIPAVVWSQGPLGISIPSGLIGVADQTATFQLVTQGQSASNAFGVPFTAYRDFVDIDSSRIGCSMTKNTSSDQCQFNGSTNYPIECDDGLSLPGGGSPPPGFWGYHASGWQLTAGANDAGVDTFSLTYPLQNNWLVSSADFSDGGSDNNTFSYVLNPGGPTQNLYFGGPTANPSWQIGWNVDACGMLGYSGDLYLYGPIGVPY
jgi:hypothetical protein